MSGGWPDRVRRPTGLIDIAPGSYGVDCQPLARDLEPDQGGGSNGTSARSEPTATQSEDRLGLVLKTEAVNIPSLFTFGTKYATD